MVQTAKKASTSQKPRKPATRKKAAPTSITQMKASHEQIAQLAHKFWAERGQQHGHHEEDWLRAEQELLGKAS